MQSIVNKTYTNYYYDDDKRNFITKKGRKTPEVITWDYAIIETRKDTIFVKGCRGNKT